MLTRALTIWWRFSQVKKLVMYNHDHCIEEHFDSENRRKGTPPPEASIGLCWGKLCSEKVTHQPITPKVLWARASSSQMGAVHGTVLRSSPPILSQPSSIPRLPWGSCNLRDHLSWDKETDCSGGRQMLLIGCFRWPDPLQCCLHVQASLSNKWQNS